MKKKLIRLTTVDISLRNLIKGQLKFLNQYYDVVGVAADNGQLNDVAEREGIRVIDVPMHREIALLPDLKCLWLLYRLFRRERPHILHCNTPKGSLLGLMAGWLAGVPHRIYLVTGLRYQGTTGMLRRLLMTMERLACRFATKVIPEGQGVKQTLTTDRITKKPLEVLHHGNINGIDTTYFSMETLVAEMNPTTDSTAPSNLEDERTNAIRKLRNSVGLSDDDFVFVFVGRMVKDKGINELTQCVKQLECKLLLVGTFDDDDPIDPAHRDFLQTSPKVKCVGWQEDVRPYLAMADALVFPSYREGFPNVPMQAGALGLPSIVTDINGCNEIVKDGENGKIIAAPLTKGVETMETELLEAMRHFISHREETRTMAQKARNMIVSRYEQRDVWAAILKMYQGLD